MVLSLPSNYRWLLLSKAIMNIDDLVETISGKICEILHFPGYVVVHAPSVSEQKIIISDNSGKVYAINIYQLKD